MRRCSRSSTRTTPRRSTKTCGGLKSRRLRARRLRLPRARDAFGGAEPKPLAPKVRPDTGAHPAQHDEADSGNERRDSNSECSATIVHFDNLVMVARRRRPIRIGCGVRLVIARCSVDYVGRLSAHLPPATRLLMVKADGSVSIHADDRAYKPLELDEPAVPAGGGARRLAGGQQGRRGAPHHIRGDLPRHAHDSAPTRACGRTASRPTCRSCSPPRRPRSAPGSPWSAGSTRPPSGRSTCSAATRGGTSRSR